MDKAVMNFRVVKSLVLGICLGAALHAGGQTPPTSQPADAESAPGHADASPAKDSRNDNFIIGNDDMLAISVWKEPDLTKSVPVRSDGKISLPLVGEIQAAGLSPMQLEQVIATKLKEFITTPEVTVIVQQVNSRRFNILGQVGKPGSYALTASTTILDAIATAGGFRDFAKKQGVYVLRRGPEGVESRLKFNYKDYVKGKNPSQNVRLEPNDTIIVP